MLILGRIFCGKPASTFPENALSANVWTARGWRGASAAGGQHCPLHRCRELEKPTWRSRDQSSIACMLAPPNRGASNSHHIHGTHVPVEEPSTASKPDIRR